jgi:hypothetical protein
VIGLVEVYRNEICVPASEEWAAGVAYETNSGDCAPPGLRVPVHHGDVLTSCVVLLNSAKFTINPVECLVR